MKFILGVLIAGTVSQLSAEENWPQWHGPHGTGVAADGDYPVDFSSDEGVAWKIALPGLGTSTPAVWGDSVFVTCGIEGEDGIVCYDMKGQERWRRTLGPERPGKHRNGSGSNPSPVTDGKHVVVYYKSGTLACLDLAGNIQWQKNLQQKYGPDTLWWDLGTSPVLAGDRVIVAVIQEGPSYLVAFDLSHGKVLWKTDRDYENARESDQAYTTPKIVRLNGKDVIVTWGADHLTGHDVETGKLLWEHDGFNPKNEGMWRVIASAAVADGIAVVPYGRGEFLAAVRLGDTDQHLWRKERLGADVPTPAVRGGQAYLLTDDGRIACIEMQSGNEKWRADLPRNRNRFYASPVLAGDMLYCMREDGILFVGRVDDRGFERLAENDMGERIVATPVPIRDGLLIRGSEHLFWIAPEFAQ